MAPFSSQTSMPQPHRPIPSSQKGDPPNSHVSSDTQLMVQGTAACLAPGRYRPVPQHRTASAVLTAPVHHTFFQPLSSASTLLGITEPSARCPGPTDLPSFLPSWTCCLCLNPNCSRAFSGTASSSSRTSTRVARQLSAGRHSPRRPPPPPRISFAPLLNSCP